MQNNAPCPWCGDNMWNDREKHVRELATGLSRELDDLTRKLPLIFSEYSKLLTALEELTTTN